jgi:hypothetical protein
MASQGLTITVKVKGCSITCRGLKIHGGIAGKRIGTTRKCNHDIGVGRGLNISFAVTG